MEETDQQDKGEWLISINWFTKGFRSKFQGYQVQWQTSEVCNCWKIGSVTIKMSKQIWIIKYIIMIVPYLKDSNTNYSRRNIEECQDWKLQIHHKGELYLYSQYINHCFMVGTQSSLKSLFYDERTNENFSAQHTSQNLTKHQILFWKSFFVRLIIFQQPN